MLQHLLVPLDGSAMAEVALPAARAIALKSGAAVTLLHVIEAAAPETVHGQRHLHTPGEAEAYLAEVARAQFPAGMRVTCHVHSAGTRDVARGIEDHIEELRPDLVIMSAHGHRRLQGVLLGGLAQQVMAFGRIPVLLVRPLPSDPEAAGEFLCRRILLPDNAQAEHEPAATVGAEVARLFGSAVRLLMVVPTRSALGGAQALASHLLPAAMEAVLEVEQEKGSEHLAGHIARMRQGGLAVDARIMRGDPVRMIARAAEEFEADLIVMATHGKAGAQAFWSGSVCARVLSRSRASMLLVPAERPAGEDAAAAREGAP